MSTTRQLKELLPYQCANIFWLCGFFPKFTAGLRQKLCVFLCFLSQTVWGSSHLSLEYPSSLPHFNQVCIKLFLLIQHVTPISISQAAAPSHTSRSDILLNQLIFEMLY